MLSYPQLRSWRSLCEFLGQRPYKFAEPCEIDAQGRVELRKIYAVDGVEHRRLLKDLYLISFIRWGEHPILRYQSSRRIRREYGMSGWTLVGGWEHKIDFLEQVYLLKASPNELGMPWLEAARARHMERQRPLIFS